MDAKAISPRFSIGRTLKDSLKIFVRNLILFGAIAIVVRSVLLLLPKAPDLSTVLAGEPVDWRRQALAIAGGIIVFAVTRAAVVLGTFRNLQGEKASIADCVRGLRFTPSIATALAIINAPSVAAAFQRTLLPGTGLTIAVTGSVSGIVGLIFTLMWWLYAPAIVIERAGLFKALSRSQQLLRGRRWHVFGLLCIVAVASSALAGGVALVAGLRLADLPSLNATTPAGSVIFLASALLGVFESILVTTAYYHLRVEKEGLMTNDLAQVFD